MIRGEAVPVSGTPAEAYLLHRGIVAEFDDLRFHPRCLWGPQPLTRFLPVLLVAAREARALRAIQRVFLDLENGG
jgi:hypothetical protein